MKKFTAEHIGPMENDFQHIAVPEEQNGERIDRFLASVLEVVLSRSYLQKLIKGRHVLVNGNAIKQNYRLRTDDIISLTIPEPEPLELQPENIPIEILYEDKNCAVINKPAGLVVHPGTGNWTHTLVNALLYHLKDLSGIGGYERPGIVHRLDKDTAGVMVVAKNDRAHAFLVEEFSGRRVTKRYTALCTGKPPVEHEIIDAPLGRHSKYRHKMTIREDGREAVTEYHLEKMWNTPQGIFSLLNVQIHTGRTHQIRVHLSSKNIPIVGDQIYSKKWAKYRVPYLLLAAYCLEFNNPDDGRKMTFSIPLPKHITDFMDKLDKIS